MVDMDASNQEETLVCVPDATSGPSVSNLQTITKPIQLDTRATSSGCISSSSTATPARRWKYDVFLSFRDHETRKGIIVDISRQLVSSGIYTFMDNPDLRVGDSISDKHMEAIENSRVAVVVLSPHYADSSWCLEELVKICECMRNNERILPLFYNVEPTEVRHQKGNFKETFTKHEESGRHQPETMKKWRDALNQVADYSAWTTNAFKTQRELVNNIVETLRRKTTPNAIEFIDEFHTYEATTKAIHESKEALTNEEIKVVGVYGMGGVGKTAFVRHVAAQACKDGTFNHWIIATVSQNPDIRQIQGTLSDLLGVKLGEETEDGRAARLHKEMMRKEKLLIILDDVWDIIELFKIGIPNSSELQNCNSKIILTTRRRNVCHKMECQRTINLSYLLDDSPDMVDMDASNQEETLVYVPDATSGPSVSNLQTITKPIQLDTRASSSGCIASSSTATPARRWKYDVFLSFRGPDSRKGITVEIRNRLQTRGIITFMDDPDLRKGDPISPTLIEAIEKSRFAVLVLSRGYADSPWCLEELVKICECMGDDPSEKRIFPIFYHLEPTEVRYPNKGSFKEAFTKHEASGRHQPETVDKWRDALLQVAGYSGWNTNDFKTHTELIDDVVQTFRKMVAPNAIEFTADFQAYEETIKAIDKVNEALRDEKVTVVGVHGMGGVGKTTMVTHVAEQARRNGIFDCWIMATISQNHNVKRVQGILSGFLGVELNEKLDVEVRADQLHKEIMRREKLLIILDDVWDEIDLSKIGIPNSVGLQGCSSKILLTTRIGNVCHTMDCHTITLDRLSDEDSWTLFKRKARTSFESPTFEAVVRTVAKECGGLPIALVTVARALGGKRLHEWKRAAEKLENSQFANPNDNGKASECIRLSYDYLKDEYKPFFLLCCLFPEDWEIEIEDLLNYAMGIQLFQDVDTLEQARMDTKILVGHLQDSCLLLGRDGEDIKMHDVVRDTTIQISGSFVKAGGGLKHWPRQIHEGCTAISLMENDISKLPENLVCPKLQILLLNRNYQIKEIPETFFQSPNDLRVVDLKYSKSLSLLPKSISLLTNLTFLSLDGCDLERCDTSVLGKLEKLEILYLSVKHPEELSIELGGLTNLRIFSYEGDINRIPPGVISKWHNLEELRMRSYYDWEHEVEGDEEETINAGINAGFEEVTSLPKLRVVQVSVFDIESLPEDVDLVPQWAEFNITIGDVPNYYSPSRGKSIDLSLDNISDLPDWFRDGLMKRADFLYWNGGKNPSDIFVDLEHGGLPKLRHLWIGRRKWKLYYRNYEIEQSSVDEIGESFTQDESHRNPIRIPVLEKLSLWKLDWEKLLEVVQTLRPDSLLNVKELELRYCYTEGNALISLATLQILSNLEKIDIDSTSKRYIFRHDELFVSLPLNIRQIKLSFCDIIGICEGRAPPTIFQNLQSLCIKNCRELEGSLLTHEVAQCLPQLDFLYLSYCPLLERIVEAGSNKTILPKLRKLTLWECPELYCESGSLDIECPSLEMFFLLECPKFAASFDDFNSRKQQKPNRSWEM